MGSVLYAGPFRSYGQLLILDAGDGYHVVLAGMSRINVTLGQSVLAGEPVGRMAKPGWRAPRLQAGNSGPELYIEFRKDGKPVDPAPWWVGASFWKDRKWYVRLSLLFAGALMGASAMSMVYGAPGSTANAAGSDTYRQLAIFGDVFDRVRADYVEAPEDELLIENAINGMLAGLDPHSSYMNAKRFQEMQVQTRGEFGGLGIEVTMENGLVKVISPIDDTPAAKAGVLAGDLIVEIDGQQVQGLTLEQAVDKMRGKVNTPINLTLVRQGREEPFEIKLVRDLIRLKAVKFEVEGTDIGYIRISTFSEQTQEGLDAARSGSRPRRAPISRATSSICATTPAGCSIRRYR